MHQSLLAWQSLFVPVEASLGKDPEAQMALYLVQLGLCILVLGTLKPTQSNGKH